MVINIHTILLTWVFDLNSNSYEREHMTSFICNCN